MKRLIGVMTVVLVVSFVVVSISIYDSEAGSNQETIALTTDIPDQCNDIINIKDGDGNVILEYQSLNMGREPYREFTAWDWKKRYANNFFKVTLKNVSDSPIRITKMQFIPFTVSVEYCSDSNGNQYACGTGKKHTVVCGEDSMLLTVGDTNTCTLQPGEMSERQGANSFNKIDNFEGKRNTTIIYFMYKEQEYAFHTCKEFE